MPTMKGETAMITEKRTITEAPYSGPCIRCNEWVYAYEGGSDGECYYCGQINYAAYFKPSSPQTSKAVK